MPTSKHTITLDDEVYDDFCWYASRHGIKISTWVNAKMKEFIEEQEMIEEFRKKKRSE